MDPAVGGACLCGEPAIFVVDMIWFGGRHRLIRLTFAGADEIHAMMRELCPHVVDGHLPVWIRNLAYRLLLLQ